MQNENDRVAPPEGAPIHLKNPKNFQGYVFQYCRIDKTCFQVVSSWDGTLKPVILSVKLPFVYGRIMVIKFINNRIQNCRKHLIHLPLNNRVMLYLVHFSVLTKSSGSSVFCL